MTRDRYRGLAALWGAALLGGCGLFESAGEVTLGEGQIPRVEQRLLWPNIDEMTGSALSGRIGATNAAGEPLVGGLPTSLKKGTLAHVQGILALAGDCQRVHQQEVVGEGGEGDDGAVSNLTIRVTNCTGDGRCNALCGDFRGLQIEASVDARLLDAEQAVELKSKLPAGTSAAKAAVVQVRMRFFELELFQNDADGNEELVTPRLDDFELILAEAKGTLPGQLDGDASGDTVADPSGAVDDAGAPLRVPYAGPHWAKLLQRRYLDAIAPDSPQRFELAMDTPVALALKDQLVAGEPSSLRLVNRIRIARPDLYELRFDGAGIRFDVQPEIVLSLLQLVKSL
jgi:hypothetical protein